MENGRVLAVFIAPVAGAPMQWVEQVKAIAGLGLVGDDHDRYAKGMGSFSQGKIGSRQVTLINGIFFPGSGFEYCESRRNIITDGIELIRCIGNEFRIGDVLLRGRENAKGYCEPCDRPSKLAGKKISFAKAFSDRGGIIAEILTDGIIRVDDPIIPPPKNYKPETL